MIKKESLKLLLDKHLANGTFDNFLTVVIGPNVVRAAEMFAIDKESYSILTNLRDRSTAGDNFELYWTSDFSRVILLSYGELISIYELAEAYDKVRGLIPIEDFYDLIESEYSSDGLGSEHWIQFFDEYINRIKEIVKNATD